MHPGETRPRVALLNEVTRHGGDEAHVVGTRLWHRHERAVPIDDGLVAVAHPEDGAASRHFSFDHTYDAHATQAELYRDLGAPLLAKAFDGWNATIFAYGQTGSGK